jgi:hypothetical protein
MRHFLCLLVHNIARAGFVLIPILVLCAAPANAEKRVALVIGNSAYVSVPRLANTRNDARLMADTLRDLGFTLVGGGAQLDLTDQAFRQIVQDFGKQLQGSDVGLFYYAGHGVQVRSSNYLVPVDANPTREADVDFQMLDANLVLLQMEGAGTKLNFVILDACRNNPLAGRGLRSVVSGLATMQSPEGTLISFATQPGNVAQDGNNGHSPYTEALAKTMRKPGLDIFRTFNEVGLAVDAATGGAQKPWFSLSPIRGEFYFTGSVSIDANLTVKTPPPDPAAQAWAVTKDTTSVAVVEDFIRQFGTTVYGSMARARLEELKKSQEATAPATLPVPTEPKPQVTSSCDMLADRIQRTLGNSSLSAVQFKNALSPLRQLEQNISAPCSFGRLIGGPIVKVIYCYNDAIYIELGGSDTGNYIMTPGTKGFRNSDLKGRWAIGTAGPPYYCLQSIEPIQTITGTAITSIGVR